MSTTMVLLLMSILLELVNGATATVTAPEFNAGNNVTLYHYIATGNDSILDCTVRKPDEYVSSFNMITTSSDTVNVEFNTSTRLVTFTNATMDNRGVYTCIARNSIGTTYLSYSTFIGGVADDIDIHLDTKYINDTYTVACGVNDYSDTPALSIRVDINGIISETISFVNEHYAIPVTKQYMQLFQLPLNMLYRGEYNTTVTSSNPLGVYTVSTMGLYIEGTIAVDVLLLPDNDNVIEGGSYSFRCKVNIPDYVTVNYTYVYDVMIDGKMNGTKYDRLTTGAANGYFTFVNTTYLDDNTTFSCIANSTYYSTDTRMSVLYAPIFAPNNNPNIKNITYINTNANTTVPCTVLRANPPVNRLSIVNDSSYTKNIKVEYTKNPSAATMHITNATVSNKGTYTCRASNDIGTGSNVFKIFVGGSPNLVDVDVSSYVINNTLMIALGITDNSDAPAMSMKVTIRGLSKVLELVFSYDNIPIRNKYIQSLNESLDKILTANYTMNIIASNPLGHATVYKNMFIQGTLALSVTVHSNQSHGTQGDGYTFTCMAHTNNTDVNIDFTVLLNNKANSTQHKRLKKGHAHPDTHSQQYTLTDLSYLDDRLSIACVANDVYKSKESSIVVFYPPVFTIGSPTGGFIKEPLSINFIIKKANPMKYNVTWYKDNKPLTSSKHVTITGNSIHFDTLASDDQAKYTVHVDNGVLDGSNKSFELLAYDGPYFKGGDSNGSLLVEHARGHDFTITCTVESATPAVTHLTILPETGPNWKIKRDKNKSVTLYVTKATDNNTRNFTCEARNNLTTATLQYNNYVGGKPDKTVVKVSKHDNKTALTLDISVTDNNDAPITNISYSLDGSDDNTTKVIQDPTFKKSVTIPSVMVQSYSELGAGRTRYFNVYAHNMLGTSLVMKYNFTVPGHLPHGGLKTSMLITAIVVPVVVALLIVVIIIVIIVIVVKKKRRGTEYAPLAGSINRGDSGYGGVNVTAEDS